MIFLPLISFILCSLFGRLLGNLGSKILSNFILLINVILSYIIFIEIFFNGSIVIIKYNYWFNIGLLNNFFSFNFDKITGSMLILVLTVSFLVHLFSSSYMENDPHLSRFMSYLSLFTFFMIILITSDNIVQLFIGWEGVGLCSYLLINFWYTRIQANKSAVKAMILNKIGDIGILLGIILIWILFGTFDYFSIFSVLTINLDIIYLNWIGFFLLIGVIGKSAQLGLHTWLPDAMEGPTPVSALIHAATMVTAGVFLIIRFSPLFECVPIILIIIILLGSLTAFFSSTIGLCQNDLKKVIAYSTCSQLGYMVMICGFSWYSVSLFHLINHGFFKALLFLSAGSIIHAMRDEQDLRRMGGLSKIIPFSYVCIVIGSISLMGLPFLTGFYSKDLILEIINGSYFIKFSLWLGLLAAFFTSIYSFRLIYWTFFNFPVSFRYSYYKSHEGNWNLLLPLLILLIFSVVIGYALQYLIIRDNFPLIITNNQKWQPFFLSIIGASLSIFLGYKSLLIFKFNIRKVFINIYSFLNSAWYFDKIINFYLLKYITKFGFDISYKILDNQLLEFFGPSNIHNIVTNKSNKLSIYHLGNLSTYTFIFIIFIICFLLKF